MQSLKARIRSATGDMNDHPVDQVIVLSPVCANGASFHQDEFPNQLVIDGGNLLMPDASGQANDFCSCTSGYLVDGDAPFAYFLRKNTCKNPVALLVLWA